MQRNGNGVEKIVVTFGFDSPGLRDMVCRDCQNHCGSSGESPMTEKMTY